MNFQVQVDVDLDKIMKACWTLLQIVVDTENSRRILYSAQKVFWQIKINIKFRMLLSYNANAHFGFNNKIQLRTT